MVRRLGIVFLASALGACALVAGIEDIPDTPLADGGGADTGRGDASGVDGNVPPGQDGSSGSDAPTEGGDAAVLPACAAQRTVHVVAGNGGFAWFTIEWPVPAVITGFVSTFAYDDPTQAASIGTAGHPLYARIHANAPLWAGSGKNPQPSAFYVGVNETHTSTPTSAISLNAHNVVAQGALAQALLAPAIPVLAFGNVPYTPAPNGPAAINVTDVDSAIAALKTKVTLTVVQEAALRPSPATLATWYSVNAPVKITEWAQRLLLIANMFKGGYVGTAILPAFNDDPHGAFANGPASVATMASDVSGVLQGFYAELLAANEIACGYKGAPLSLADNVVFVVNGDTPKDSFVNAGWPDGTPQNTNYLYVRSNGWLAPGWFGQLTSAGAKTNFDPAVGTLSAMASNASDQAAAMDGLLYAISRGNLAFVTAFDASEYAGVRAATPP